MAEGEEAAEEQREKLSKEEEAEEPRATGKAASGAAVLVAEGEQMTTGEGAPAHRGAGADATPESLAFERWEAAASSRAAAVAPLLTLLTLSSPALTNR